MFFSLPASDRCAWWKKHFLFGSGFKICSYRKLQASQPTLALSYQPPSLKEHASAKEAGSRRFVARKVMHPRVSVQTPPLAEIASDKELGTGRDDRIGKL